VTDEIVEAEAHGGQDSGGRGRDEGADGELVGRGRKTWYAGLRKLAWDEHWNTT
jgi:hypothetical protein